MEQLMAFLLVGLPFIAIAALFVVVVVKLAVEIWKS